MCVFTGRDTDTIWLKRLSDSSMSNNIIGSSRLLDEPRLDRFEDLHVFDSLWDIPDLVSVDHEDTTGRTGVFALDRSWVDGFTVFGHVCWVVDDLSDQKTTSKIVLGIGSDFELQCQCD
jgi:hypothetical protein